MAARDGLHLRFVQLARKRRTAFAMADSTGMEFTYHKALVTSLVLASWIRRGLLRDSQVGILLPPSVMGAIVNTALLMAGKIPVNLNYTVGREAIEAALKKASIRTIITSRAFVKRIGLETLGFCYLEDIRPSSLEKALGLMKSLLPSRLIARLCHGGDPEGPATILPLFKWKHRGT